MNKRIQQLAHIRHPQSLWVMMSLSVMMGVIIGLMSSLFVGIGGNQQPKIAFVSHQQLFEGYQGRKDVAQILTQQQHLYQSDSIQFTNLSDSAQSYYLQKYDQQQQQLQQKAEQYTAQIWQQINAGILEYGHQHHYTFIFGATGTGSLMYADSTQNITQEIITYLNQRYAQKTD